MDRLLDRWLARQYAERRGWDYPRWWRARRARRRFS